MLTWLQQSVGGIRYVSGISFSYGSKAADVLRRASNYNAVPIENVEKLAEYMSDFARAKSC